MSRMFKREKDNWSYPLKELPVASLKLLGYSEDDAEATCALARIIKKATTDIKTCDDKWFYKDCCHDLLEMILIPNQFFAQNDALLPHWEELSRTFTHCHHGIIDEKQVIRILNVELPDKVCNILRPALNQVPSLEINFTQNQFGSSGIDFVIDCIQNNTRLQRFSWCHNLFHSEEDLSRLCEALSRCPNLGIISISHCNFEDGIINVLFRCMKSKSLIRLELERNNISKLRACDLSDLLSSNPSLDFIDLSGNNINTNDVHCFAEALQHDSGLVCANFYHCEQVTFWDELQNRVIFDDSSLNTAYDSNHVFRYFTGCSEQFGQIINNGIQNHPKVNRSNKIYHMLSKRNKACSNIEHFRLQ